MAIIKKIGTFIVSRALYFALGILIAVGATYVYATWDGARTDANPNNNPGQLSEGNWNELVAMLESEAGGGGGGSTFTKCQVKFNPAPQYPTCPDGWTVEHTYASAVVADSSGGRGIYYSNVDDATWSYINAATIHYATLACSVCEKDGGGGGGGITCDEVLAGDSGAAYCGYSAHEYCQAQGYQYAMPHYRDFNYGIACRVWQMNGECGAVGGGGLTVGCSHKAGTYRPLANPQDPLWCCK